MGILLAQVVFVIAPIVLKVSERVLRVLGKMFFPPVK